MKKKRFKYDFHNREIKQNIENEFYTLAAQYVKLTPTEPVSIVTGPDWQRHVKNALDVFGKRPVHIYEINDEIYVDIYTEAKSEKLVKVNHASIETATTTFIDCDLTCLSDVSVIERTLVSQLVAKSSLYSSKAFIATVGLRGNDSEFSSIVRKLFGLLGVWCYNVSKITSIPLSLGLPYFKEEVTFKVVKSRVQFYKCYVYNAGGGPMLTMLMIYR